jgi:hypothetical protein
VNSCGSSCTPCPQPAGGTATCTNGTCRVACANGTPPCGNQCCPAGQQCNQQTNTCAALPGLGFACVGGQCGVGTCFLGRCCETQCSDGVACDTQGRCDDCSPQQALVNGLSIRDCPFNGGFRTDFNYCVAPGGGVRERALAACQACSGGPCGQVFCQGGNGFGPSNTAVNNDVWMFEPGCAQPGQVWSNTTGQVAFTF